VRLILEEEPSDASEIDETVAQAVATLPVSIAAHGTPGVAPGTIADTLKKSDKTIKRALDRLLDAGRVVVTGRTVRQGKLYKVNDS
jgi:hypothetical protein